MTTEDARMKASPGPWRLVIQPDTAGSDHTKRATIVDADGRQIADMFGYGSSVIPWEARATLIADAWTIPALKAENAELRAALEYLKGSITLYLSDNVHVAADAKATQLEDARDQANSALNTEGQ